MARTPIAILTAILVSSGPPVNAADSFSTAVTKGNLDVSLRWRLENVDQDPFAHDATAIPLRLRLGYTTAELNGFSAMAEFDYVADFGLDNYNEGGGNTPDRGDYPVIADPSGADINQVYLQYKQNSDAQFRIGRQRIIYDNARFVGNVGWRQNEQTYDSVSFNHTFNKVVHVQYAFVDNVNRIFGNEVDEGDHEHNTHLFNLGYSIEDVGKIGVYYYDIDDEDAASLSNRTWGVRFNGSSVMSGTKIGYGLEYASQKDGAGNPVSYNADYWRLDLSVGIGAATVYAGYESLGGDKIEPGQAFITPLATLHAFNGWADKFLGTPATGLDDVFAGVKGNVGTWNWNVLYHDFSNQSDSTDIGYEIDAYVSHKFTDRYSILFKAADFNSDRSAYGDTTKLWVQLTATY